MVAPIDYSIDVKSPFETSLAGYQAGAAIKEHQLQIQQREAAQQQQVQMQNDIGALVNNPQAGAKDYAGIMLKYPQMGDHFKKSWEVLSADQQNAKLEHGTQVHAALLSGQNDVATQIIQDQADAYRTAGNEKEAKASEAFKKMIEASPGSAKAVSGLMLSQAMGADKYASAFGQLGGETRAIDTAPSEKAIKAAEATTKTAEAANIATKLQLDNTTSSTNIANTVSQIQDRSKRLALDTDKFTSEVQMKLAELNQKGGVLPEFVAKDINAAVTDSIAAAQSAETMTALADRIDKNAAELGGGVTATLGETWKKVFGDQNDLTRIRAEYNRIVTPAAMAAYKKVASGSTSDKDIDVAMTGVPKDTSDPAQMASFLRGAAKLQTYDSVLNSAKSEWLNSVNSLGKAKTDMVIEGVKVPAGSTFLNFQDQFLKAKVKEREDSNKAKTLQSRGYMKYANEPAAPQYQPIPNTP